MSRYKSDKAFNYDHLFKHISKDIKSADLSVVDQQTVFYIDDKEDKRKVNEKRTPKELGDAIAKVGFNLVLHANVLAYMYKDKGIYNTINYWKKIIQIYIILIYQVLNLKVKKIILFFKKMV